MKDNIKISIITVCQNSEDTIRNTIDSVLSQTYKNVEYIVIDGLSQDRTMDIVNSYGNRIDKVVSERDRGIYDAMNKGIKAATGDIIGVINSDDYYLSHDIVEKVAESFEADENLQIAFGDVIYVDPKRHMKITRYYDSRRFRPWKMRFGWMPPHTATFIRRNAYERFGLYSLKYSIASDFELLLRMLMVHRCKFAWLDMVMVVMRTGGVSTGGVGSSITLNREIVAACKDNGIYTNYFLIIMKIPFKLVELVKRPGVLYR